jgi:DNA-binding transcriptional LysR family regulator
MINLNHLRVFYHTAKNLSYTEAGRELLISQPAVTKQVKTLEEYWDLKLFSKKGSRVYLTEEGHTVLEYAKKIFENEMELEHAVEDIKNLEKGILRLAVPQAFMSFLSFLMDIFNKKYPHIRIKMSEGSSLSIIQSLLNNETEIALISKVEDHPDINFIHLCHDKVAFTVSSKHNLANKKSISLKELSSEPIILRDLGSGSRKLVLDLFEENQLVPNIQLETNNKDFIIDVVKRKEMGAFLIEHDIEEEFKEGNLVEIPISGHELILKIYIAFLKFQHLSIPAKAFFKVLGKLKPGTKYFPNLVSSWPQNCPFKDNDI